MVSAQIAGFVFYAMRFMHIKKKLMNIIIFKKKKKNHNSQLCVNDTSHITSYKYFHFQQKKTNNIAFGRYALITCYVLQVTQNII